MTDYTITTNFGAKDSLPSGNAAKVVKGSEFTTEFTNIATAVNSKADTAGDTFTGVVNFSDDVAFDTDTLFVDASTNRVGIGTTSPAGNLHISAGTDGDATLILEADTDNAGSEEDNPRLEFRQDINEVQGSMYLEGTGGTTANGSISNGLVIDAKNEEGTNRIQFATGGTTGSSPTNSTVRATITDRGHFIIDGPNYVSQSDNYHLRLREDDGSCYLSNVQGGLYIGSGGYYYGSGQFQLTDGATSMSSVLCAQNGNITFSNMTGGSANSVQTALERMRIDSSGNVGIGTTAPDYTLDIEADTAQARIHSTVGNSILRLDSVDAGESKIYFSDNSASAIGAIEYHHDSNYMSFDTVATERMRIDSSGNLFVGTTDTTLSNNNASGGNSNGTMITPSGEIQVARYQETPLLVNRMGNDGICISIRNRGVEVGRISTSSTGTAYITSSDERLKENITDSADAGSKVDAIQIRQFDWKVDGSHQDYGVIAQELIEVVPEAVAEGDTEEDMMGVDYSKLVPLLVKEVQALRSRVAQLEESV